MILAPFLKALLHAVIITYNEETRTAAPCREYPRTANTTVMGSHNK